MTHQISTPKPKTKSQLRSIDEAVIFDSTVIQFYFAGKFQLPLAQKRGALHDRRKSSAVLYFDIGNSRTGLSQPQDQYAQNTECEDRQACSPPPKWSSQGWRVLLRGELSVAELVLGVLFFFRSNGHASSNWYLPRGNNSRPYGNEPGSLIQTADLLTPPFVAICVIRRSPS